MLLTKNFINLFRMKNHFILLINLFALNKLVYVVDV